MARRPEGPKLKWPGGKPGSGIARVRFTHAGRRYDESTGTSDVEEAERVKLVIYADIVSGRVRKTGSGVLIHPGTPTLSLWAKWLVAVGPELGKNTDRTYGVYGRHWSRAMPTIGDVTEANIGTYQRQRLTEVKRKTLTKELGAGRSFLRWCKEQGFVSEVPRFPPLPKKATGTPHKMGRRKPDYVLSAAEVEAIIAVHPAPDFFIVCWETGLRPDSTVSRLERSDLLPGNRLRIRPEADKNRWGRIIPVSDRAYAALQRSLPFGFKDRIEGWKTASRKAIGRETTPYDAKHARVTLWVNAGMPLGGISRLTGVSIETLTKVYAHADDASANLIIWGNNGNSQEMSNVIPLRKSQPAVGTTPTRGPGNTEQKASRYRPDRVKRRPEQPNSGGASQNPTAAEFRAKARAWFRRAG